jgi:serine/threonine protein kinase
MIQFACSQCARTLKVADNLAGKKARCPACGEVIHIPAAATITSPPAAPEGVTLPPASARAPANEAVTRSARETVPQSAGGDGAARVPGYEILEVLGGGGMGVIYKARQLRPRRLVALKMILAGEHAGADALARFRAEAEAVARLSHPNIVQIYEVGEQAGRPFLTLEYIDGGNLAQKLRQERLKFGESAELVQRLARAVQFAHKRGIVHRDLKPANVLLGVGQPFQADAADVRPESLTYTPKITDFGLAKQLDAASSMPPGGARTRTGAIVGTPAYMAPEQAEGKSKKISKAVDVYALGAILYECLTGKPPFEADTMLDTLLKVATEEPVPPRQVRPKCPRDLETICLKCLQKDPARRYTTAGALAEDLRRYLEGEPIWARPAGKLARLGRGLRRRKELTFLAGGALLAGLLVLLLLVFALPGKPGPEGSAQSKDPADAPKEEEPAESPIELAARRQLSKNNLAQLAIAMHNHHDAKGSFPPASINEGRGRPLLSWRVALLPYIEQDNLYRRFKLTEPWDGPNNRKLLALMPKTFEAPGVKTREPHSTFYQVFVGWQTAFQPGWRPGVGMAGQRMLDFTDGTSNTILIAEAAEAVPWTKPVDMPYFPSAQLPKLGGVFKDGFHVALADASVVFVSRTVSEKTLRAAITRNAGDVLGADWPDGTEKRRPVTGGTVSGKVSFRGAALSGGTIAFHPVAKGKKWSGRIGKDGTYKVEGMAAGEYVITVTTDTGNGVQVPRKYADAAKSPVRYTVGQGADVLDLDLKD